MSCATERLLLVELEERGRKHVEDGHVADRPPWSFLVWGWVTREQQGGYPEPGWGGSEGWDMGGGS